MPTPEWVREKARKRRERTCPVCGVAFIASRPSAKGLCSRACQDKHFSSVTTGRKHSAETRAKMSESGRAWRKTHPDWEEHRRIAATNACRTDEYVAGALARYRRMVDTGTGICSAESKEYTSSMGKWVLKKAKGALELETDFMELWTATQDRLRREMPYDGPLGTADYFEYLQKLGKALTTDPAIRAAHDEFMKEAIPRFSAEWRKRKGVDQ